MQNERYSDLIDKASAAAQALTANQAMFFPGDLVVARSSTGKLRVGTQWGVWWRADADEFLREHLKARLTSRYVYDAEQFRRNLTFTLDNPKVFAVANVGRRTFHTTSRTPVSV